LETEKFKSVVTKKKNGWLDKRIKAKETACATCQRPFSLWKAFTFVWQIHFCIFFSTQLAEKTWAYLKGGDIRDGSGGFRNRIPSFFPFFWRVGYLN
jgi:hypothetical protein